MSGAIDFTFPHPYECEVLENLPGYDPPSHRYFSPGRGSGGGDGVLLRVKTPEGSSWLGTFAFGSSGKHGVTRVMSMPDPARICVVSKGQGYLVPVSDPERWEPVWVEPVIDIRSIAAAGLIVFADHTHLVAYGAEGLRWKTKRLTWSNMKLTTVTDEKIVGEYDDLGADLPRTFEVDVATGKNVGGVEQ